ncbi:MAG: LysR family transcriptional regulator [Pseudomonadota bacterium]
MRVSVKALRYFLVAAEQGSISRAAEQLNVVPSAISNAIELVEAEFELKLVQRYPAKGIAPTATGVAMMRKIRHLIEEYDSLLLEGAELRTALSGSISVGYYAPVAPAFMPEIVGPLVRDNPDVALHFVECDNERAQSGLLDGAFDVILFVAENARAGIVCETLIEAPPYLLLPEGHPFAAQAVVELRDLSNVPLVLLDLPFTSAYYRGLLDDHGVDARIVATASTTEMVRSLVGAGIGCTILNMRPSTSLTYAGDKIVAVPIRTADPARRSLKLVMGHLGGKPRRLTRTFMGACSDYFSRQEATDLIVPNEAP